MDGGSPGLTNLGNGDAWCGFHVRLKMRLAERVSGQLPALPRMIPAFGEIREQFEAC